MGQSIPTLVGLDVHRIRSRWLMPRVTAPIRPCSSARSGRRQADLDKLIRRAPREDTEPRVRLRGRSQRVRLASPSDRKGLPCQVVAP